MNKYKEMWIEIHNDLTNQLMDENNLSFEEAYELASDRVDALATDRWADMIDIAYQKSKEER